MIPAILSCVFVIYLYQSLNADASKKAVGSVGAVPLQDLSDRVAELNERLHKLKTKSLRGKQQ